MGSEFMKNERKRETMSKCNQLNPNNYSKMTVARVSR